MNNNVYSFCRTNSNSISTPKPSNNTVPQGSGTVTESGYTFKSTTSVPNLETSKPKTLEFTEEEFPSLCGSKGPVSTAATTKAAATAAASCWSNPQKREIIKDPFKAAPVVPRQNIPPLFAKVKKTVKVQFVDDYDEEEDCSDDDYDYNDNLSLDEGEDESDEDAYRKMNSSMFGGNQDSTNGTEW